MLESKTAEHTEGEGRDMQGTCRSKGRSQSLKAFHAEKELCLLSPILSFTQV